MAITTNTIRTTTAADSPGVKKQYDHNRHPASGQRCGWYVAILLVVLVTLLQSRELGAALAALPGTIIKWETDFRGPHKARGVSLSASRRAHWMASVMNAQAWSPSLDREFELARLTFAEGKASLDPERRIALFNDARAILTDALAQRPTEAFEWMRLANLHRILGDEPRRIIGAVMLSIAAHPSKNLLLYSRIRAAIAHSNNLTPAEWTVIAEQIVMLWHHAPRSVMTLVREEALDSAFVSMALSDDAKALAAYQARMRRAGLGEPDGSLSD